jgi:hypothetical protein
VHSIADPGTPMTLAAVQAWTAEVEPVFAEFGRIVLLTNGRAVMKVSAEARRHLAEWSRAPQIVASAIYDAHPMSRALLALITGAMNFYLQAAGKPTVTISFFSTELEARRWLSEKRRLFLETHPELKR